MSYQDHVYMKTALRLAAHLKKEGARSPALSPTWTARQISPRPIFSKPFSAERWTAQSRLIVDGAGFELHQIDPILGKDLEYGAQAPGRIPDREDERRLVPGAVQELMPGNEDKRVMAAVRKGIKHVIYIIKENRCYDQILGDLESGNGDPDLAEFGEWLTPNEHNLARKFVTLDNFYDTAEVSIDGWPGPLRRAPAARDHWSIGWLSAAPLKSGAKRHASCKLAWVSHTHRREGTLRAAGKFGGLGEFKAGSVLLAAWPARTSGAGALCKRARISHACPRISQACAVSSLSTPISSMITKDHDHMPHKP
jgi:hypothetical protein